MLNRRHIRVKVMQSIYAMHQNNSDNLEKQERYLFQSIENIQDLYLAMLSVFIEIKIKEEDFLQKSSKKYLVTQEEKNPNMKFVNNEVFQMLADSKSLHVAFEDRKINNWRLNDDYVILLLDEIKRSNLYKKYISNRTNNFEEDKSFIIDLFTMIIAPNEKLYDYLEDYKLTWVDDIPLINTAIVKQLRQLKASDKDPSFVFRLYKNIDDKDFARDLFRKTVLNESELSNAFIDKTPNWDMERIAEIDAIILKMAVCEFLKFSSIPVKVTINEYLEIAKEYSTPKSSIFINGVLDNIIKEYQTNNRLVKTGRGLM